MKPVYFPLEVYCHLSANRNDCLLLRKVNSEERCRFDGSGEWSFFIATKKYSMYQTREPRLCEYASVLTQRDFIQGVKGSSVRIAN